MNGKICMVTGANAGIGKPTALALARQGATVVMVCRDRQRGEAAMADIMAQSGSESVDLMIADLSSQGAIRRLAEEFRRKYQHLHVLVNNAGVILGKRSVTEDGLETTFAVNHLAYFLLTNLLLDVLIASAPTRIVNVSSGAHSMGIISLDDLWGEKRYGEVRAYSQSKLANILFTYELAMRLEGTGVTANCLHPGNVATNFGNSASRAIRFYLMLRKPFMLSPDQGAETSIYLASSPEVEGVSGRYFIDKIPAKSSKASYSEELAKLLWEVSAELTNLTTE